MYRCPRCNVELAPDAHYCPGCGFNQTNVNIQKVPSPQTAQSKNPTMPSSVTPTRPLNQPEPSSSLAIRQQMSPRQPENFQQQTKKNIIPPRPVRASTPRGPVESLPTTPPIPNMKVTPQQQQVYKTERAYQSHPYSDQSHPHIEERPEDAKLEDRYKQADETNIPGGFSLTQRYLAEQETRHQPLLSISNAGRLLEEFSTLPTPSVGKTWNEKEITSQYPELPRGDGATSTKIHSPKALLGFDTFTGEGAESLIATSKAAEHWHQSWRERQHAEAGPAVGITRGQADVPEPLMAMQNSLARMRAIIIPKNSPANSRKNFSFWFTLILLLCLIAGMCVYVISTYVPSTQLAAQISGTGNISPTLTLQGIHTNTIAIGQTLHVHGMYFGSNHAITFILDTTPLSTPSVQSNKNGTFDASLTIPTNWLAGSYALQAQDNRSGLHAFLDLQILSSTVAMSNNTPLVLTMNDQPLSPMGLTFKTVKGKDNVTAQRITLTNNGNTPVQWNASAIADNNLNWLLINNGKTGGTLTSNGTDSVDISVSTAGLSGSTKPYRGSFILTVKHTQAIVPVSLTIQDTSLEVVVNPDPVIAYLQAGGTCQPTNLTLINLSDQVVTWNANPYNTDKPHIHLDGLTTDHGTLDPQGSLNNTKVIQITCIGTQVGEKLYHISIYYNGVAVNVPVTIRYA